VLDDSKRLQLALPVPALIQEEDLPQDEAADILFQTLVTLQA
jgi:hypothetical protein